ncbi:MAG: hypothetical protein JXB18_14795 [Sedimentisphaerales bacterium]|nr:hypothetical protein [Sedimentisphaerales bacterium]
MTDRIWIILLLVHGSAVYAGSDCNEVATELIQDAHFTQGFRVIAPGHGARVVEGYLNRNKHTAPAWDLVQWHSRYPISKAAVQELDAGARRFANEAKSITICPPGRHLSDLILMLDSHPEFQGKFRQDGQPWPHLLVEQAIARSPSMAELKSLKFHIEAKLLEAECDMDEGYRSSIHTAQVPFVLTIQNCNPNSPGYGDFGWFIIPLYDQRYRDWPEFIAQDTADPSKKMIYTPGAKACGVRSLHDRQWVTVDTDLLPILLKGMEKSWKRGYLAGSRDLHDYRISSFNLGWEVTGLAKASIQIRNLGLKAVIPGYGKNKTD